MDLKKYPKTKMFQVVDTIGVPHPYCITPKHLSGDGMYLDKERIIEAEEKYGAVCDICRKIQIQTGKEIMDYEEHKQALLIEVTSEKELKDIPQLKKYLLKIKAQAEKDGFVGFAFKQNVVTQ